MTVSTTTSKVSYSGNGSTTAFSVGFYFLANSHLKVIVRASDGTETVKTLTTDYTVSGAGNPSGGTVTMLTCRITSGFDTKLQIEMTAAAAGKIARKA